MGIQQKTLQRKRAASEADKKVNEIKEKIAKGMLDGGVPLKYVKKEMKMMSADDVKYLRGEEGIRAKVGAQIAIYKAMQDRKKRESLFRRLFRKV